MILRLLKVTLGWIVGVTGYEFFLSLWQNKEMNWEIVFQVSVGGFIGILIGLD
ncbi:hypothetical protein ACUL41_06240 [Virgibacillus natechei]